MLRACVNRGGVESLICAKQPLVVEQECRLPAQAQEALRCWQARCGAIVTVCDSQQNYYRARISHWQNDEVSIVPFEMLAVPESPLQLCVYQALPAKERFDWVLQKLTEIGVSRVVPFTCGHSSTLEGYDAAQKKSHRWPQVILRASRQCRRAQLMELAAVHSWEDMLQSLLDWDIKLLLAEKGSCWTFNEGIGRGRPERVAVIIGPEGGFDSAETEQAQNCGAVPVSLGARILRTETAALVAATLAQHCVGDYV